jgi:hypothetical protein
MNFQYSLDTFKLEDTAKIWTAAEVQRLLDEQQNLKEQVTLNAKIIHAKDLMPGISSGTGAPQTDALW